jgi:2-keto-4-pentenoate hydratase/2-oxohepta-3-ene-1,7-dioic acid hydratase in catechol pathway
MKFLTLENGQLGAVTDTSHGATVVDLMLASQSLGEFIEYKTMAQLLAADEAACQRVWALAEQAIGEYIACRPLNEVKPLAPLPEPRRNIICLGKNYREHAEEIAKKVGTGDAIPKYPIFFTKATTTVIGSGEPIPAHSEITRKLDYEAELAIIIGKGGRGISRQQAMEHVFGYTAFNDVSARDLQGDHLQWYRGKSLDGFGPMGPIVVHRSVMPPPEDISIQCFVNGEQRQQATLAELIFDIPSIIETLSAGATLLPGDIIATGTPAGVGMGFSPSQYLQPGDEVVVAITGAGRLVNSVA